MSQTFTFKKQRPVTDALARHAYLSDRVRLGQCDTNGFDCLVSSRQGLFSVASDGRIAQAAWGSFFGIRQHRNHIFLFEACDRPSSATAMGRIIRLTVEAGIIGNPVILAKGLDNNCHQIAIINETLCVVDTANQRIVRFTLDGDRMDEHFILDRITRNSENETYRHVNSIASIGGRIALMLHNGSQGRERNSELLWLDENWAIAGRLPLPGRGCHDIVPDGDGRIWHCGSMAGEIINDLGLGVKVSDMMTRGLAWRPSGFIVGYSQFGKRVGRERLAGGLLFLDTDLSVRADVQMEAAPTDLTLVAVEYGA